jgi:glycosyltransferase involved in cell wall biosynthesis
MIPKLLHFIWLGDEAARPDRFLASWAQHHPDWTIKLWGNDDLQTPHWRSGPRLRALLARDARAAAALLRWEVLLAEGGLAFDIDSLCLRPLDESLLRCEAFACWQSELAEPGLVSARFVGSVPHNPFIESIVSRIDSDPGLEWRSISDAFGSGRLTETWHAQQYEALVVHPSHYFIPRHPSGLNYEGGGRVYAIHAWAGTPTAARLSAARGADDDRAQAAQRPMAAVATPAININFFTQIDSSGIGRHSEGAMAGLLRAQPGQTRVNYLDCRTALSVRMLLVNGRHGADTTVFFHRHAPEFIRQVPGRRVLWTVFESDRLPPAWLDQMRAYDRVWTPSDWCRDVLLAHGLDASEVRVVEEGVDPRVFHPAPLLHPGFVFLSVGKYEARKSIDETIEAFVTEFPASREPAARLWLKADYPGEPARASLLRQSVASDWRIRVISDTLSDAELARLYNSADAFVFASKAEGFGLPCIEAAACGVPLIATDYSGQSTILKHMPGSFVPVDYDLVPIDDADFRRFFGRDYGAGDMGRWAQPSIASLRQAMRRVYEEHARWRALAVQASETIRTQLSWDCIGAKLMRELGLTQPGPMAAAPVQTTARSAIQAAAPPARGRARGKRAVGGGRSR